MVLTKEMIDQRVSVLELEIAKVSEQMNSLLGAIRENRYLLSLVEAEQKKQVPISPEVS